MEIPYWIGRKRQAIAMARSSASSQARLAHYDLAGRYSVIAVQAAAKRERAGDDDGGPGGRAIHRVLAGAERLHPAEGAAKRHAPREGKMS